MLPFEWGKYYIPAGRVSWRGGEWSCCTTFCLAQVCLESWAGSGTVLALNHSCGPGHCGGGRDQQPVAHNQLFEGWAVPGGGCVLGMLPALPRAGRSSSGASHSASWQELASGSSAGWGQP